MCILSFQSVFALVLCKTEWWINRLLKLCFVCRHISILPSLHLSIKVSPQEVIKVRPPMSAEQAEDEVTEDTVKRVQKTAKPGQPPVNHSADTRPFVPGGPATSLKLFYPQGLKEFSITVALAVLSLLLLIYFLVILYKCCCSRNYDKWRSSWSKKAKRVKGKYFRQIKDSLPLILKGHALVSMFMGTVILQPFSHLCKVYIPSYFVKFCVE